MSPPTLLSTVRSSPKSDALAVHQSEVVTPLKVSDLMDEGALAALLSVSRSTLQMWRYNSRGPRFLKIGRLIRYRRADVDAFLAASEQMTSSGETDYLF